MSMSVMSCVAVQKGALSSNILFCPTAMPPLLSRHKARRSQRWRQIGCTILAHRRCCATAGRRIPCYRHAALTRGADTAVFSFCVLPRIDVKHSPFLSAKKALLIPGQVRVGREIILKVARQTDSIGDSPDASQIVKGGGKNGHCTQRLEGQVGDTKTSPVPNTAGRRDRSCYTRSCYTRSC
eukprot:COSAG02_NODE_3257_length_7081_cov_3.996419_5_plen_182_part_00